MPPQQTASPVQTVAAGHHTGSGKDALHPLSVCVRCMPLQVHSGSSQSFPQPQRGAGKAPTRQPAPPQTPLLQTLAAGLRTGLGGGLQRRKSGPAEPAGAAGSRSAGNPTRAGPQCADWTEADVSGGADWKAPSKGGPQCAKTGRMGGVGNVRPGTGGKTSRTSWVGCWWPAVQAS